METIIERYKKDIDFVISCYDRIVLTGTLPEIAHSKSMTNYLYDNKVRIFDYAKFAEPYREQIRQNAERIAKENNVEIEFLSKSIIRKETIISEKLKERGTQVGLVHILSCMETCNTYKPWHDKRTGKTFLKPSTGKCLHYYFYFIDEELGLCYVRVPTWCPFRLQVYFNGHNLLSSLLKKAGVKHTMIDNAFETMSDAVKAQELADQFSVEQLHRRLELFAWQYCPVYKEFKSRYHWSIMQAEYSTDIVFKTQTALAPLYSELVSTAIHTVKPDNIATFFGQKLDRSRYTGEIGNTYNVRTEGSRIKHTIGCASIKIYDKFGKILRIEATTNNVSFFKHYREVEHRDGTTSNQIAPLKKNIYSLAFLSEILKSSNRRYIEFISEFDNKLTGRKRLEDVSESKTVNNRNYKGFNFFSRKDLAILLVIARGEFNISGFRNKHLQNLLKIKGTKISRLIKRLLTHGLIKKITDSYKYYLTALGKHTIITAQKLKEFVMVPAFCF